MPNKFILDPFQQYTLYSFCIALIKFYSELSLEDIDKNLLQEEFISIKNIINNNILQKIEKQKVLSTEQINKILEIIKYIKEGDKEKIWELQDISDNISEKNQEMQKILEDADSYLEQKNDLQTRSGTQKNVVEHSIQLERSVLISEYVLNCVLNILDNTAAHDHKSLENRYLNCGFCSVESEETISTDQALNLKIASYRLKVNIGKFWGIGTPNVPIPDKLLKTFFEEQEYLELDVVISSFNVEIKTLPQKLKLPNEGDSEYVFFDLTFTSARRHSIDIDLLLQGHLLQSKRVEVDVVKDGENTLYKSAFPTQDSYITWTRSVFLNPKDLVFIKDKPRKLTIVAKRDIDYNRIGLRFYDTVAIDLDFQQIELGFQQIELTDAKLTKLLIAVRKQLLATMNAYSGSLGSTEALLTKHLAQLAVRGRKFYLALLPGLNSQEDIYDQGQRLNVDLQPETVIQVAPLSSALGVPWELLYERKTESYEDGRFKLCSTWHQHGLKREDCPSYGTEEEATIICPHAFWGYRYIIEQLPCKLDPHKPIPKHSLPLFIRNNLPLLLNASVSNQLRQLNNHLQELQNLASVDYLQLLLTDSREKLEQVIKNHKKNPVDILYFYTHGGIDEDDDDSPYLQIGNAQRIALLDLDAWNMKFDQNQPFVILNACDSANYTPDKFENLLQFFCNRGAAGVIGTQCEVKEMLANAFILNFFNFFLQQTTAGEALFKARQTLLRDKLDPRGLVYSLFASADIKLAQPVINSRSIV